MLHTTPPRVVACLASPEALDLSMLDRNYDTGGGVVSSILLVKISVPTFHLLTSYYTDSEERRVECSPLRVGSAAGELDDVKNDFNTMKVC
jgi:hypothetical protein